jgi:SAM-dependent methyltransferase
VNQERRLSFDITRLATRLSHQADGIWMLDQSGPMSFPVDGNERNADFEGDSFWFAHRQRCLITAMRAFDPGPVFVDIGGGTGFVSAAVKRELAKHVVVIEPDPAGARVAKRRGVDDVICGTLESAGIRADTLPSAGLFDVIEHIEDDVRFLKTVTRLLAPGAYLYVTVPAYQVLWSQNDEFAQHYRRYSRASLRRTIAAAGLSICFDSCFFWMLPLPLFILRALPYRLGLRHADPARAAERGHKPARSTAARIVDQAAAVEPWMIAHRHSIPFGGSCLLVARKN